MSYSGVVHLAYPGKSVPGFPTPNAVMRQTRYYISSFVLAAAFYTTIVSGATKQGLAYLGNTHTSDNNLLLSAKSPINWYYTWSLNQAPVINSTISFVPLISSIDDASNTQLDSILEKLPGSSTHLLAFNEPDGTTDSGGSAIEPADAARSYIYNIAPLRKSSSRAWNVSHPAVTGSSRGLDWLRNFNSSCYDIDPAGCPMDFVAVHWYGDFAGLASWLGTLYAFYNPDNLTDSRVKFWVTEMALPQGDENATVTMLNQSMSYLDGLSYVEKYAWFGAFRANEANEWTGNEVSLFDNSGALTEVGSLYLGGEQNGFTEGMKGEGGASRITQSTWASLIAGLAVMLAMW